MNLRAAHLLLVISIGMSAWCPVRSMADGTDESKKTVSTQTSDGVTVFGERYYRDLDPNAPLVLLFHQGGSNGRAEYEPLVEWLNDSGFRAIAWDQRTGGDRFGGSNRTVDGLPEDANPGYCDAFPDLQAALDFALGDGDAEEVIIWGSSYSAALVFRLAAENPGKVSGLLAFSPASGGPMAPCRARRWVNEVDVPAIVFKPASEMTRDTAAEQREILEQAGVAFTVVDDGIHGSSLLVDARTGNDMSATREEVIQWLDSL